MIVLLLSNIYLLKVNAAVYWLLGSYSQL